MVSEVFSNTFQWLKNKTSKPKSARYLICFIAQKATKFVTMVATRLNVASITNRYVYQKLFSYLITTATNRNRVNSKIKFLFDFGCSLGLFLCSANINEFAIFAIVFAIFAIVICYLISESAVTR